MGAPKRNRRKYDKPKDIWNLDRIHSDNGLINEYGLKNMKELWSVQTNISRIRRNVRLLLSGGVQNRQMENDIISSLSKSGIIGTNPTIDNILDLKEKNILDRRLQTIVFKNGMARTIKQARQIITHGFIAINGKRVNKPGYTVSVDEERQLSYYKPINIAVKSEDATAKVETAVVAREDAEKKGDNGETEQNN